MNSIARTDEVAMNGSNGHRTPAGESWAAANAVTPGTFRYSKGQRVIYRKARYRQPPLIIEGTVTEMAVTSRPAGEGYQQSNGYVVVDANGTRWLADETSLEAAWEAV